MTRAYWLLDDGTRVYIPREPIDRAGITLPGLVERPDGRAVWVYEEPEPAGLGLAGGLRGPLSCIHMDCWLRSSCRWTAPTDTPANLWKPNDSGHCQNWSAAQ